MAGFAITVQKDSPVRSCRSCDKVTQLWKSHPLGRFQILSKQLKSCPLTDFGERWFDPALYYLKKGMTTTTTCRAAGGCFLQQSSWKFVCSVTPMGDGRPIKCQSKRVRRGGAPQSPTGGFILAQLASPTHKTRRAIAASSVGTQSQRGKVRLEKYVYFRQNFSPPTATMY